MQQIYQSPDQPQAAFRALSDPTRRSILMKLAKDDLTIGDIVDQFDVTRGAIKKHLIILEEGGLISVHKSGRERINRLEPAALKSVDEWLQHFHQYWDEKLGRLQDAVARDQKTKSKG